MDHLAVSKLVTRWVLTNCPGTGDEVVGSGWDKQFSMPSGETTWWRCPSCGGWHIMKVDDAAKSQQCPNESH